jgi:hypothetical protein
MIGAAAAVLVIPVKVWRRKESRLHVNEVIGANDGVTREFRGHAFVNCRFAGNVTLFACAMRTNTGALFDVLLPGGFFSASHCVGDGGGELIREGWSTPPEGLREAVRLANSVPLTPPAPIVEPRSAWRFRESYTLPPTQIVPSVYDDSLLGDIQVRGRASIFSA